MIDDVYPITSWFLWGSGAAFLFLAAIPLIFAPLWWASLFKWSLPQDRGLATYLGRCLGVLGAVLSVGAFIAAPDPAGNLLVVDMLLASAAGLGLVHIWGALRREQPWPETLEIVMYAAILGFGLGLRPVP